MNRFHSLNRCFQLVVLMLGAGAPLFAVDVDSISLRKHRFFTQTGTNAPVFGDYASSHVEVVPSGSTVSSALLRFPDSSFFDLPFDEDFESFRDFQTYTNQNELDDYFPPGTYQVEVSTVHDGTRTILAQLNNTYPNPPRVINASTIGVNAGANFILRWDPFMIGTNAATANDTIEIFIDDGTNTFFRRVDYSGTNRSIVIPARSLASGKQYTAYIAFCKVLTRDTTSYPGVPVVSDQSTETGLFLETAAGPAITAQPTNKTVVAGSPVTFSVSATGSALTYQWRVNGTNIAGGTNSSLTFTAQPSHGGNYSVIVTSSTGYTISAAAFLTVDCGFTTTPSSALFSSVSATGTISVQAASTSCTWTATTTNNWITFTGATNGAGNGSVDFLVTENTSGISRLGFIVIAGRMIPVTQTDDFAPTSLGGKTILINVTNATGTLPSNDVFLFITLPATNRFVTFELTGVTNEDSGTYEYAKNAANHATVTMEDGAADFSFLSPVKGVFSFTNSEGTQQGTFIISDTRGDFNKDGRGDILFQNTNGVLAAWLMSGTNFNGSAFLRDGIAAGTGWRAVGTADFDGDGHQDLLFFNTISRKIAVWFMDGTGFRGGVVLRSGLALAAGWRAVGAADLSGDGSPDILFQHTNSKLALWRFNGTNFLGASFLKDGAAPVGWRAEALADFNQDGSQDLIFHHTDGRLAIWNFVAGNFLGSNPLMQGLTAKKVGAGWRLVGLNDFNNDGKIDLLFQHETNRKVAVWFLDGLNGNSFVGSVTLRNGTPAGMGWTVFGPR